MHKHEWVLLTVVAVALISMIGGALNQLASDTVLVTATPVVEYQYVPIVVTAEAQPSIPGDLWRCIQNPTLAQAAPDQAIDYRNFAVVHLSIIDGGRFHVYQVYSYSRNELKPITVEYGVNIDGQTVLVRCDVPEEWRGAAQPTPTFTVIE